MHLPMTSVKYLLVAGVLNNTIHIKATIYMLLPYCHDIVKTS